MQQRPAPFQGFQNMYVRPKGKQSEERMQPRNLAYQNQPLQFTPSSNCDLISVCGVVGISHIHHIHLIINTVISVSTLNRNNGLCKRSFNLCVHSVDVLNRVDITQRSGICKHDTDSSNGNRDGKTVSSSKCLITLSGQSADKRRVYHTIFSSQRTVETVTIARNLALRSRLLTCLDLPSSIILFQCSLRHSTVCISRLGSDGICCVIANGNLIECSTCSCFLTAICICHFPCGSNDASCRSEFIRTSI